MILVGCSSALSPYKETPVSEQRNPTMAHEPKIEQGLLGNTIQFWLWRHGLANDQTNQMGVLRDNQPVDRPTNREADQRLGSATIQKPDRQLDRQLDQPLNQQPVRQRNRPVSRSFNRQLDRGK